MPILLVDGSSMLQSTKKTVCLSLLTVAYMSLASVVISIAIALMSGPGNQPRPRERASKIALTPLHRHNPSSERAIAIGNRI